MSSYKLVYFKVRGKGELTRLVFHAAGVEFEDVRHDRSEWLAGKIDKEGILIIIYNIYAYSTVNLNLLKIINA